MKEYQVFGKRIVIKLDEDLKETASGIIVMGNQEKNPRGRIATVIKPSDTVKDIFKPDDRIMIEPFSFRSVDINGNEFHIVNSDDVILKFS